MKKLTILLALLFLFAALPLPAAEVKNTVVRQVGNRGQFTYDLLGDEPEAEVDVTLTIQGKEYKAADLHLEGDCGKVKTGRGRVIWWNILQDFPRGLDAAVKWRVEAGGKEFKDAATGISPKDAIKGKTDKESVYAAAYETFKEGKYDKAQGEFQSFLNQFPNTEYSDNAQFWIGECYFLGKKYEKAILEYEKVVKNYPQGDKVSYALLKQGFSFLELGDKSSAKIILQQVIKDYPNTNQASIARVKLYGN